MNEARPFASLSSGLLARKGAARPAMRPQGFTHGGFDDLGWNDMGGPAVEEELPEHVPSSISALTPAPRPVPQDEPEPEVVAQQRAIAETFETEAEIEAEPEIEAEAAFEHAPARPAEVVRMPRRKAPAPVAVGKKAAFTLRVDAERHLRLRLATAVTGRSAQQLVTAALDQLLASIPEVEALAERVPASGSRKS